MSFIAGADGVGNGGAKDRRGWLSAIENTFIWTIFRNLSDSSLSGQVDE